MTRINERFFPRTLAVLLTCLLVPATTAAWADDAKFPADQPGETSATSTAAARATSDTTASAEDSLPAWSETTLTGDWQGRRKQLAEAGWQVGLLYAADFLHNYRGGQQRGSAFGGHTDLIVQFDGEKSFGWRGGSGYLQLISNSGGRFNQTHVNSLMGVDNFEAPVNRSGFFRAWLQQSLWDDRVSLRAGLYPVDTEFYVTDSSGVFLHPSFGMAAEASAFGTHAGPPIYPTSTYGVRLRVAPAPSWYGMLALTRGIPADRAPNAGTNVSWRNGSGSLAIGEIGLIPVRTGLFAEQPAKSSEKSASDEQSSGKGDDFTPISKVAVGAWRFSPQQSQITAVDGNGNALSASHWGAYFLAEQSVYRFEQAPRDIALFFRAGMTDGRTSFLDRSASLGLSWRGPFAGPEKDTFGVAATRSHAGRQGREQLAKDLGQSLTSETETVFEMTYQAQVMPGVVVQPMLQRILNPGLHLAHSTVAGARIQLAF